MKIAVNHCWGGFGLSHEACLYYAKLKGMELYTYVSRDNDYNHYEPYTNQKVLLGLYSYFTELLDEEGNFNSDAFWYDHNLERDDPFLIQTIEDLGTERASGYCGQVEIVEIPDDVKWVIRDYDGMETVEEAHRSW